MPTKTIERYHGVKDVAFDGVSLPDVSRCEETITVHEIAETPADGVFPVFAKVTRIAVIVTLASRDLAAVAAIEPNTVGTLTYTLMARGTAADRVVSATAVVLEPAENGGRQGDVAEASVRFMLLSEDGTGDPRSVCC